LGSTSWADRFRTSPRLKEGVGQKKGGGQTCLLINAPSSCVGVSAESSQLQASVTFLSDQNCGAADHA
jgi:hypothetical protein